MRPNESNISPEIESLDAENRISIDNPAEESRVSLDIEQAHDLLNTGKRTEAYQCVKEILEKEPENLQARALRDRIDSEDFSVAIVQKRGKEDVVPQDVHPLLVVGFFIAAVMCGVTAIALAGKDIWMGIHYGFGTPVPKGIFSNSPIHFQLIAPGMLVIMGYFCFTTYRRARV